MQMLKKELKDLSIINLFLLTAAGTINAFGVSLFLFPVKLYDSGISGLSADMACGSEIETGACGF